MPDLHTWITRQVDHTEAIATDATAGPWHVTEYTWYTDFDAGIGTSPGEVDVVGHGYEGGGVTYLRDAQHIAAHDPAAVLRRCEADRRILNRHRLNPDAYWADAAMCAGCGTEGEMDYPRTENLNDCPELLDLGHAHGLTDEILATLDRPQEGERPERTGPSLITEALAEALYGPMIRMAMRDVPAGLRGPNWKARP